jgi:hypothetical protein
MQKTKWLNYGISFILSFFFVFSSILTFASLDSNNRSQSLAFSASSFINTDETVFAEVKNQSYRSDAPDFYSHLSTRFRTKGFSTNISDSSFTATAGNTDYNFRLSDTEGFSDSPKSSWNRILFNNSEGAVGLLSDDPTIFVTQDFGQIVANSLTSGDLTKIIGLDLKIKDSGENETSLKIGGYFSSSYSGKPYTNSAFSSNFGNVFFVPAPTYYSIWSSSHFSSATYFSLSNDQNQNMFSFREHCAFFNQENLQIAIHPLIGNDSRSIVSLEKSLLSFSSSGAKIAVSVVSVILYASSVVGVFTYAYFYRRFHLELVHSRRFRKPVIDFVSFLIFSLFWLLIYRLACKSFSIGQGARFLTLYTSSATFFAISLLVVFLLLLLLAWIWRSKDVQKANGISEAKVSL